MAKLVVQHKVRDYAAWRPVFDAHETSRRGAGITNGRVYRRAEDPNDLVLLFDVADVAKARTWAQGEDLKRVAAQSARSCAKLFRTLPCRCETQDFRISRKI